IHLCYNISKLRDEPRIQEEMKMKFIVNGHEVEFTVCTAIAASIGDTERQNALFVHDCDDEFGDGDSVIFGVDMPETDEEAAALMCEPADSYQETLDTVEFYQPKRSPERPPGMAFRR